MNNFKVEGIPQRETIPDKKREKLEKKLGSRAELLPATPFTGTIYGRIGAGKSSVLYSLLKNMFPNYFDEVIIFCGTADSIDAFESLPQKNLLFLTDYDETSFNEYISQLRADQLERLAEGKPALRVFIGLDDIVFSQAIGNKGKPSSIEKLMLICRHELNASVVICCQHSKQITPAMRNNSLYHIICPVVRNDLEKIASEHANHLSEEEFIRMYHKILSMPGKNFIVVDYKAPEHRRFRHNWDKIITFGIKEQLENGPDGTISEDEK